MYVKYNFAMTQKKLAMVIELKLPWYINLVCHIS